VTRVSDQVEVVDRRAQRREAKWSRIVAEAWGLARRDGLAAISLRDLAERVDLRQPSLYAYFDSKLDLFDAMFADGNRQLLRFVAEHPPTSDDPTRALAEFVRLLVRFSSEDTVRHQLLFQRTIPGFEPSAAAYEPALQFYAHSRQLLAAAGANEDEDVDLFSALVTGLAHQQVANDPGGDRWSRLADRAVEMFLADVDRRRSTTTANPTTANPTTVNPTTVNPTTVNPTTVNPTTVNPTTVNGGR
jgi:AcrR family transcriptional regulator